MSLACLREDPSFAVDEAAEEYKFHRAIMGLA